MPGLSGIDFKDLARQGLACADPHASRRAPRSDDRLEGLETGADDYLTKADFEPRELVLRIRLDPAPLASPPKKSELRMGPFRFSHDRGELTRDGKLVRLTSSELTLLKLLAQSAGKPLVAA